jgi:membrane protease YdiL (CAAX protease family)
MAERASIPRIIPVGLVFLSWIAIGEAFPLLVRALPVRGIHPAILAAARMTLLFLATWLYLRYVERKRFADGFRFGFHRWGRSLLWAAVFFGVAVLVLLPYQLFVVQPLAGYGLEASAVAPSEVVTHPFLYRLVEYLYVVYEGFIEVLIFIGFLFDRLLERCRWWIALIVANLGFALWHYPYWDQGWLPGTLMIGMTFLLGTVSCLNYLKTRNSLSPAVLHFLVDSPNAIRELLGMIV